MQRRIVVILSPTEKELKSVHYALSLAERVAARVFIVQQISGNGSESSHTIWLQEALSDLISSAREAGLTVSHHISGGELKADIIHLAEGENIDVLVFSDSKTFRKSLLQQIKPLAASQIIQVKEKNQVNYI